MERELVFRVIEHGREYALYSNGDVEGFSDDAVVVNFYSQLERMWLAKLRHSLPVSPTLAEMERNTACRPTEG